LGDRRNSPRTRVRLSCTLENGRKRYRARLLDVSAGGLCLLSPVPLEPEPIALQIDVPGQPPVELQVRPWHLRRVGSRATGTAWCIGMLLEKAGDGFEALLPESAAPTGTLSAGDDADDEPTDDVLTALQLGVYRVGIRPTPGGPIRTLTLGATSAVEAIALVECDVGSEWTVVEVREA
jgi:hypothetical protein